MKNNIIKLLEKQKEMLHNKYLELLSQNGKFNELKQIRTGLKSLEKRLSVHHNKVA